jgi:hypothetical protein
LTRGQIMESLSLLRKEDAATQLQIRAATEQAAVVRERTEKLWVALEEMNRRAEAEAECLMKEIEEEERREAEVSLSTSSSSSGPGSVPAAAPAAAVHVALDAGMFDPLSEPLFFEDSMDPFPGE